MLRRFFAVLGIACGCGSSLRARPAAGDHLEAIGLEGNRAVATGALEPGLALHETLGEGAAIDPYLLAGDTERIRIAYWKRGFFEATVTPRVERTGTAQRAVFAIVEGRRAVTRVEITGLPPELPVARARALVALRDGEPFDYEVYGAAQLALKAAIENAGYAHVDVAGRVIADPAAATATVRYDVAAGELCRFGAIRVAGAVGERLAAAARDRLRFATGDRYSVTALEQSRADIFALGRFSTVQLVPDRSAGSQVDVAIELAEASRHEAHVGGGLGYEGNFGLGAGPGSLELRGRGGGSFVPESYPMLTMAAEARGAMTILHSSDAAAIEPKIRLLATVSRLDLFRPRIRGDIEGGLDYQTVEAYTWSAEHGRLGLGLPLGRSWLQLHLGWLIERVDFPARDELLRPTDDKDGCTPKAQQLGVCDTQIIGAYQASLVADLRDNPIEPHRGAYLDLRAAAGTPYAGGELSYLQLTPELRGYVSLGRLVIAARARVGAILGDVPAIERYYSGGSWGHRGFINRKLSPRVTGTCGDINDTKMCSVEIGGAGLIETGIELRHPLGTVASLPLGANVFLDGGDVTETPQELDPSHLYWAIGTGVWGKLVGDLKLRIDVGYRLNRTAPPDPLCTSCGVGRLAVGIGVGESY